MYPCSVYSLTRIDALVDKLIANHTLGEGINTDECTLESCSERHTLEERVNARSSHVFEVAVGLNA